MHIKKATQNTIRWAFFYVQWTFIQNIKSTWSYVRSSFLSCLQIWPNESFWGLQNHTISEQSSFRRLYDPDVKAKEKVCPYDHPRLFSIIAPFFCYFEMALNYSICNWITDNNLKRVHVENGKFCHHQKKMLKNVCNWRYPFTSILKKP